MRSSLPALCRSPLTVAMATACLLVGEPSLAANTTVKPAAPVVAPHPLQTPGVVPRAAPVSPGQPMANTYRAPGVAAPQAYRPQPQAGYAPGAPQAYRPQPQAGYVPGTPQAYRSQPQTGYAPGTPQAFGQRPPQAFAQRPSPFTQNPAGFQQARPNGFNPRGFAAAQRPMGVGMGAAVSVPGRARSAAVATSMAVGSTNGSSTVIWANPGSSGGAGGAFVVPLPVLQPPGTTCGVFGSRVVLGSPGAVLVPQDCQQAQAVLTQMDDAQTGQVMGWTDRTTGVSGSITPTADPAPNANGQTCRSYQSSVTLADGTPSTTNGVTCRTADGDYTDTQPAA